MRSMCFQSEIVEKQIFKYWQRVKNWASVGWIHLSIWMLGHLLLREERFHIVKIRDNPVCNGGGNVERSLGIQNYGPSNGAYRILTSNSSANIDTVKPRRPQLNTKRYKQLRNIKGGRNRFPYGRAHQLIIQYQVISPEITHVSNIIYTEQGILRCLGI